MGHRTYGSSGLCVGPMIRHSRLEEPEGGAGDSPAFIERPCRRRKYSDHAIETAVTVSMVFGLASRQTEGFLRSLLGLLNLDNDVPDHTTISRRKARLGKVPFYQGRSKTAVHILIPDRDKLPAILVLLTYWYLPAVRKASLYRLSALHDHVRQRRQAHSSRLSSP